MPEPVTPPAGLIPSLSVRDARAAIAFYQRAFGARLNYQLDMPDGRVGHAELQFEGSTLMLADEFPEMGFVGPEARGGTSVVLTFYVADVDAVAARAVEAGATLLGAVENQFYGDRVARLRDPFGHAWSVHMRVEEVSPQEMRRRMQGQGGGGAA